MISNTALRVVENNSFASKDFTIQASGKMFHMVISGLYSNKPQSITREIWSNAYDAHAMVGKYDAHAMVGKEAVPFEVTFPTALSPTFRCRDFGPGIAHENMEGFYTVLGHSTKENTNKAVGKWGVGRMSPLSYTDTFSVVSRHKGMVAHYAVQLGPDGSPQLHVLAPPMPTTEAEGLEVSFPVKRSDIHAFSTAAEIVSYGFAVPPSVTNSQEKTFATIKKIFEGDDYYLYEDSRLTGAYAQMGCVLYPIPQQYLSGMSRAIVYKFDIGDLEVTASREALSFGPNDPTAANIRAKDAVVEASIVKKMQDELDAQPKLFLAAKLEPKLRRYVRNSTFNYRGQKLPRYWELNKYTTFDLYCGYKGYRQKSAGWGLEKQFDVKDSYTVFIQDTSDKKGCVRAATRIAAALTQHSYYIWVRADLSNPTVKADVDTLVDELDFPVHHVKDLPDAGSATRGTRAKVTVSLINKGSLDKYEMDDVAFNAGGYYYKMSNNDIPRHIRIGSPVFANNFKTNIIMVPKTLWAKFEKQTQWVEVEPTLEALVKSRVTDAHSIFSNRYSTYPMSQLGIFKDVAGPVGDFAKKVLAAKPSDLLGLGYSSWNDLLSHYNLPVFDNKLAEAEHKTLLDKYPLLRLENGSGKLVKEFTQYINMINNAAQE